MVNESKINPLNVFDVRRTEYPLDFFEYANINFGYNLQGALEKWIDENLKGRYYLGKKVVLTEQGKIDYAIQVGFEDSKELSYFMLACPYLKYN